MNAWRWPTTAGARAKTPTRKPALDARAFDLLCLTIAFVLGVHASHLPWWLAGTLAVVLAARWWQRRRHGGRAPMFLKLPLMTLLLLAVMATYGTLFGRDPGSAFAVGLLVLKLLETETARDARVGVGFGCFGLMAALLFDQGLVITVVVALGLLPAVGTLRALEPAQPETTLPRALLPGLKLLAAAVPLSLLAFVLIPRLSSPLWGAPNSDQARTGLSDSMSPGNLGELLTDDRPAMRVGFGSGPPAAEQRYFRAYVMSHYDGRTWSYTDHANTEPAPIQAARSIAYTITLEPTHQSVLPMLDVPLDAPAPAVMRHDRVVRLAKPIDDPLVYSAHSAVRYRLQTALSDRARRRGLSLPDGFDPRARKLGASWRKRFAGDDRAIIRSALALFHDGGFRYTLTPAPLGRDTVDDFLFDTHEGFCEHYASAFTVLMRAAGIPARVVTGYQGGYWNALGHYLLVRQSDAHAWSEVWLAGSGWVRVDPTAAVRPERVSLGAAAAAGDQLGWSRRSWLGDMRNRWDVLNRWWNQGVVGFNALRQHGLLTPFGVRDTTTHMLGLMLAGVSMLFAALGLAWALWRREPREPLHEALRLLQRKLTAVGIVRRHSEGPQHYLSRAARGLPQQREQLDSLMRIYLDLRYAQSEPPHESVRRFHRAVREFMPRRVVK